MWAPCVMRESIMGRQVRVDLDGNPVVLVARVHTIDGPGAT